MNTNALKKFAQEARRKLLAQVEARLEYALTHDTAELREKALQIKSLRDELARSGKTQLVEKVAYTWFNRLMALRFMDANDFQPGGIRIVSPKDGYTLPQLLDEAKQGGLVGGDWWVVDGGVMERVNALLDGKLPSANPQNEAYRLLLIAACNALHRQLPFLFEKINDYTELLLPADLTSEFSIVHDLVQGMSVEDCRQVEIIGWLYQFYISEKKDEVFASKSKVKKEDIPAATQLFTPRWIVEYMVQNTLGKLWLQNRPHSRLREHMPYFIESASQQAGDYLRINSPEDITLLDQACGSGHILVYAFELLARIYEEEGYAPVDIPRLILEKNLYGFEIDGRAAQLAGFSLLMKARGYYRRLFRKEAPAPNILLFEDVAFAEGELEDYLRHVKLDMFSQDLLADLRQFEQATNYGSLMRIRTQDLPHLQRELPTPDLFLLDTHHKVFSAFRQMELLGRKFHCVVDNPPYMGSGNMNPKLADYVKTHYPESKADLMACFMEAGWKALLPMGYLGMINQHSWMFLSSYEKLRFTLIEGLFFDTLLHLGPRTFPEIGGEVVQNAAFTFWNKTPETKGTYLRLVDAGSSEAKRTKTLEAIQNPNCGQRYTANQKDFEKIPGSPVGYWVSKKEILKFNELPSLKEEIEPCQGLATTNNSVFLRYWNEVAFNRINFAATSPKDTFQIDKIWFPVNKGGGLRRWYGNRELVIEFSNWGKKICDYIDNTPGVKVKSNGRVINRDKYFKPAIEWNRIGAGFFSARFSPVGAIFETASVHGFPVENQFIVALCYLNSKVAFHFLAILSPTLTFQVGDVGKLPIKVFKEEKINKIGDENISIAKSDWDSRETSWDFPQSELLRMYLVSGGRWMVRGDQSPPTNHHPPTLEECYDLYCQYWTNKFYQLHRNEEELNRQFIEIYGLQDELTPDVPLEEITILKEETSIENGNLVFHADEIMAQFISYAVGCMFGRYSLDKEGLILANQGEDISDYLAKVEKKRDDVTYPPDEDGIIPVLDDEWFEDDIVGRFHDFLKAAFGKRDFQKNLSFVEEKLGKDIRKYFVKDFYADHVQRYKKRPIYWLFSSPKGSFNALVYLHRYTPDTLNNLLNHYLREFIQKLKAQRQHFEQLQVSGAPAEQTKAIKAIDKLDKMLLDCEQYERDILFPLAAERIALDLDDGVLVNYNKLGKAVKEVSGLNDQKTKEKVRGFDWIDVNQII